MRDLNANALAKIATAKGIEPVIIVEVDWHGTSISYADKEVSDIPGKILEITNLDTVININTSSSSQEISITLIDIDGTIKNIIDNYDVHKRDVQVYQWFEGLSLNDRFLLFKGKINSPITWDEGKRRLSFNVLSNIEDNEIGYSIEEGQNENMPNSVIGKSWPMCFGTTTFSKTLRLTARTKGTLADSLSFPDFALAVRKNIIELAVEKMEAAHPPGYTATPYTVYARRHVAEVKEKLEVVSDAVSKQPTLNLHPRILGGENFPQDTPMYIKIGNTTFYGQISGDVFSFIGENQHPDIGDFHSEATALDAARELYDGKLLGYKTLPYETQTTYRIYNLYAGVSYDSYYNGGTEGDNAGYVNIQSGTQVSICGLEPQTHIISVVPGTVTRVAAWAEKEGQRFLQDIDPDNYRVYTEEYGDLTMTFLELNDALSKRREFNWEDDIYVIFESSVGPNTVDILQYLIETFSDFTVDAVSFAAVKTKVENYPSHFALTERKELFTVLQEIAWQARCAIWLKNGVFYIQYVSEEPTPVATITESDIEIESLILEHTPTEDLVTKMVCMWRESGLQENPHETILRHNVAKYGTHEQRYDFYIYNYVDAVIKSATFWMIRYSNTWKKLKFVTPLTLLNIETFDAVTLDFNSNYVASEDVVAMVENATYNSVDNAVEIECWCPVKAGTSTPYLFAYPAQVDEIAAFPTEWEIQQGYDGGNSPGRDDTEREGFGSGRDIEESPLIITHTHDDPYNLGNKQLQDRGNPTPSDIGDTSPGAIIVKPLMAFGSSIFGASSMIPTSPIGGLLHPEEPSGVTPIEEEIIIPCEIVDPVSVIFDPNTLPSQQALGAAPHAGILWIEWWWRIEFIERWCNREFTTSEIGYRTQWGAMGEGWSASENGGFEKFVFTSLAAADRFKILVQEYMETCHQVVGHPAPISVSTVESYPSSEYTHDHTSNNIYGMLAYDSYSSQNPWITGLGSWLEGGPPVPSEWVDFCNGEMMSS